MCQHWKNAMLYELCTVLCAREKCASARVQVGMLSTKATRALFTEGFNWVRTAFVKPGRVCVAQPVVITFMTRLKDLLRRNATKDLSTLVRTKLDEGESLKTVLSGPMLKKKIVSWVELRVQELPHKRSYLRKGLATSQSQWLWPGGDRRENRRGTAPEVSPGTLFLRKLQLLPRSRSNQLFWTNQKMIGQPWTRPPLATPSAAELQLAPFFVLMMSWVVRVLWSCLLCPGVCLCKVVFLGSGGKVGGKLRPKLNIWLRQPTCTVKEGCKGFWKEGQHVMEIVGVRTEADPEIEFPSAQEKSKNMLWQSTPNYSTRLACFQNELHYPTRGRNAERLFTHYIYNFGPTEKLISNYKSRLALSQNCCCNDHLAPQ